MTSQDGTRRVLGYVPLSYPPVGLYLSVGLSAAQSFETIDRAGRIDLLIVLAGVVATLAATAFVGWQAFLRPLQALTDVLRRWRDGEHGARTGHSAEEGEIAQLGATLDALFDQLARAQADRELVTQEMAHRVKNTMATVLAIAGQTLNKAAPANQLFPAFQSRIAALAQTHEVLLRERWEAADLEAIVRGVVSALCDDVNARFQIEGPSVELPPREALAMTLVIHELCTNAVKYGALANDGSIAVDWTLTPSAARASVELVVAGVKRGLKTHFARQGLWHPPPCRRFRIDRLDSRSPRTRRRGLRC